MTPDQLFALTPTEFMDMKSAYEHREAVENDILNERQAWLISAVLNASQKVKKQVSLDKLYKRRFDENDEWIEAAGSNKITKISPEDKAQREAELLAKFNNA